MPILPDARKPAGRHFSHRTRNPTRQGRAIRFGKSRAGMPGCNLHKASRITAINPATGEDVTLFHPIRQLWSQYFRFEGYRIESLTAVGRATVEALHLNHSRRQRIREVEEAFGLYPPTR